MAYADEVLADSPALYWRLGESSGTNANDETANNRDGTYVNAPTLAVAGALSGDADTAVELDGSTEYISSSYNPFTNGAARTFEGWAWRDTSGTEDSLFGSNGSTHVLLRLTGTNNVEFRTQSTVGGVTWTAAWPGNAQWVYWALTFNESTDAAELYINGSLVSGQTLTAQYNATPGNFIAGARGSVAGHLDGRLDEIAIYTSVLSSARVSAHYNAGIGAGGPAATNRIAMVI